MAGKGRLKARGVRLPEPIWEFYQKEADEQGTSVSDRIRRILERHKDATEKYERG